MSDWTDFHVDHNHDLYHRPRENQTCRQVLHLLAFVVRGTQVLMCWGHLLEVQEDGIDGIFNGVQACIPLTALDLGSHVLEQFDIVHFPTLKLWMLDWNLLAWHRC